MKITNKIISIIWTIALLVSLPGCINFEPDVQPINVQSPPNSNTPIDSSFSISYDPNKPFCNQGTFESKDCGNDKYGFFEVMNNGIAIGALVMIDGVVFKIWKDVDGQYLISCGTDESGIGHPISQEEYDGLKNDAENIRSKSVEIDKKWDDIRSTIYGMGAAAVVACGLGAIGVGVPTGTAGALPGCLAFLKAAELLGAAAATAAIAFIVKTYSEIDSLTNSPTDGKNKYENEYKAFRDKYVLSCSKQ